MGRQVCTQVQRERLDALAPRPLPVGEDVVVDLAEQPFDQGVEHGGLVREVRVHGVGRHADPPRDAPERGGVHPALVEQCQCRVEDLALRQGAPGTRSASCERSWPRRSRLP
jgi:hypothetical protein